jgi:hypothetical protein
MTEPVNNHPRLVQYGLESMAGDPVEILHRHLTNNHAATLGAKDMVIQHLREALLNPEVLADVLHPDIEQHLGCTHQNQHLRSRDCGNKALEYIERYHRLAEERYMNNG